jgi:hypothetical protein
VLEGKRELRVSLRLSVAYVVITFVQTHTWKHGTLKQGKVRLVEG